MSFIPIIVIAVVFILIAIRRVGTISLKIWKIMLLGAVFVLVTAQISPQAAVASINWQVMLFLFGMFIIASALEKSNLLATITYFLFNRSKSVNAVVLTVLFAMGILSAFIVNDSLAIIGTPIMIYVARKQGINPKLLVLSLAFAITIGSVFSPIGNPQNLLIASTGKISHPFITFWEYLFLPTMINLIIAFAFLRIFYRGSFTRKRLKHVKEKVSDPALAKTTTYSLALLAALILINIALEIEGISAGLGLAYIALLAALPIVILNKRRFEIIRNVDYNTLIFFASLFILVQSVWNTGFLQSLIYGFGLDVTSVINIFVISVVASQFISNVPLTVLYLPLLSTAKNIMISLLALAAGSTIAGNFTILGAASNVIIVNNLENKHNETLTFWEFARIGIPLTIANTIVYILFLKLL